MAEQHRPHLDRKDLKKPDEFFESVGRLTRYYQHNRNTVVGGGIAIAAVFLAVVGWSSYRTSSANAAAAAFLRATDALDLDSLETAKAALGNVADRSGAYGDFATLYLADIKVREGSFAEAADLYEQAANESVTDYVKQIALVGRAFCMEQTGSDAQAAQIYATAAKIDGPYREQALRGQLRAAVSATDRDLSAAAIETLLELYPDSPDADELSRKLASLKG